MKEHALKFGKDHSLVGVLTEDDSGNAPTKNSLKGVLLLNAGDIHHIGPSRVYVKMARRLAAKGFLVLRFDFSGIGDSGQRTDKLPETESVIEETRQAMDYLERSKGVTQFCCIGVCAGAAAAARVSLSDFRVNRAILINPALPETRQRFLIEQTNIYRNLAIFRLGSWVRFLTLKSNYLRAWDVVSSAIKRRVHPSSHSMVEPQDIANELRGFFQSVQAKRVKLFIVYSEIEFVEEYFKEVVGDEYRALKNSGLLTTAKLRGADHLVTPLSSQEDLLELISNYLAERC